MYDRIVIAVDASDEARRVASRGLELGRTVDASVRVLHVVEGKALGFARTADGKSRLRERSDPPFDQIEDVASDLDLSAATELTEGKPAAEINEYATEESADLLVVGRDGTTRLDKRLLGGVTEQVLHGSEVPVFVVPGKDDTPGTDSGYSRVLVPTDGSENPDELAAHGATLAERYGAEVHVLNVVDLHAEGGLFSAGGLQPEFVERLEARGREAVDRVASEIEARVTDATVTTAVERTTSHEGAAAGVREYAEDRQIDLVVMGSRGRSNLKRRVLGSVASNVLRTVDVPVLVVKRTS